jgi:hypothetical protein
VAKKSRRLSSKASGHKPKIEIVVIQAVYTYLKDVDLTWTLDCLINETQVQPEQSDFALIQLLFAKEEGPDAVDDFQSDGEQINQVL